MIAPCSSGRSRLRARSASDDRRAADTAEPASVAARISRRGLGKGACGLRVRCALHESECDCTTQGKAHETPLALHDCRVVCRPYVWCSTRCFTHVMWRLWIVSAPVAVQDVVRCDAAPRQYGSDACTNASLVYNERGPATFFFLYFTLHVVARACMQCLHAPSTLYASGNAGTREQTSMSGG